MSESNRAEPLPPPPTRKENQDSNDNEVKVYFGIFFDGTLNHRQQALYGEEYRAKVADGQNKEDVIRELNKKMKEEAEKKDLKVQKFTNNAAQENDRSNVALLYEHFNEKSENYVCLLYMEGIGTDEAGEIYTRGKAFGKGKTGVKNKVETAFNKIHKQINEKLSNLPEDTDIYVYFELFGFSRGAAAARHFIWYVRDEELSLTNKIKSGTLRKVIINYTGLFDTVSTYGANLFSEDDVKSLNLDAVRHSEQVFQICAADEFREKFALTNIDSAIRSTGEEIFIPGAHSDIGGGYAEGDNSVTLVMPFFQNKTVNDFDTVLSEESLKHLGWIRDGSEKNYYYIENGDTAKRSLKFNNKIKKGYSYIGLELMAENANNKREKKNMFKPLKFKTPEKLINIKNKAMGSISLKYCHDLFREDYKTLNLRKDWLHFSSRDFDIGMGARIKNGIFKREIIKG